ncbi:MAG TPA: ATP-binding protein, partial [Terriglobales bacterium]|nr:ATP-binding protein [Terriglobales bacterium]
CDASCDDRCVVLAVADSGMGMSAETLSHMFEPFFTTKELGRGTGLGLATVYGILEQCGARIEVDSEPGRGTQFRICFPLAQGAEDPAAEEITGAAPEDGSGTVLLVEDEEVVRALAQTTLERRGYHVLGAACGTDALEIALRHEGPIDLVVTDVVMPEMGGPEVALRLRKARPGIKVLYVSGYAPGLEGSRDKGLDAPLLPKPFALDAFERKVREVMGATT